uniref:G-protein coupled receptors family 1 profile domain-containing protein n=1 Tax=Panagrolaimus sp. ES5 TaxID=591445 RepID=A0AC34FF55_9BILA
MNDTNETNPYCVLTKRSDFSVNWLEEYSYIVSLILCSIAGNLTVVWIVLRHERMRTVTNYYLLNLAISDLAITVLNTGFSGTYNLYYNWVFSDVHCAINNLMGITPICASVFTMIVMSVDRYLAIVYPLRRRPGRGATVTIIICIWVLALICGLPALAATKIETHFFVDPEKNTVFEDHLCLADKFPDGNSQTSTIFSIYNHTLVIMQYLLPLIILSFTYGRVAFVLRQNNVIGDTRHTENIRAKRKAANMLALVVFTFIFLWLPYNLYFLFLSNYLQQLLDMKAVLYLYINIYCLGMSSCLLNPIIYYFMNERFRLGFRYAFRWLPWVKVKKEEYESVFSSASRASHLASRFTIYSTNHKSGNQSPIPL